MNTIPNKSSCSACGTSPVNHRVARFFNIVDEVIEKTIKKFFLSLRLPYENILVDQTFVWLTQIFYILGLVRYSSDNKKALSGRSELIWEEALRREIPMEQIVFCGKHIEQYRAYLNGRWFYFTSLPIPPWLPQKDYDWADDKLVFADWAETAELPVPKVRLVTSWESAQDAFNELAKPVIIKPRLGSRGRHTTTNISTLSDLRTAYNLACEIARELVIEEHLFGSVCRATVIDGKLVGFFSANPPKIHGDGSHTVSELIAEKNKTRDELLGAVEITEDLTSFIARRGYTLDSVLSEGVSLDLSAKTGRFYGGHTKEMLPDIHPKMHAIFEKAGALINAPVIGIDLITVDPTIDPDTVRWGIIECNSLPFIDLHYYAYEGERIDLAKNVWDLWITR